MKRIAGIFLAALLALTVLPHGAELVTSDDVTKGIVTTAYAEDALGSGQVSIGGVVLDGSNTKYYKNGGTEGSASDYDAKFENGVLTLNELELNGQIVSNGDLTIVVHAKGATIDYTTTETGKAAIQVEGNLKVTYNSYWSNLTINTTGADAINATGTVSMGGVVVSAIAINGSGIVAGGKVDIDASARVNVKGTYGIYSKVNATYDGISVHEAACVTADAVETGLYAPNGRVSVSDSGGVLSNGQRYGVYGATVSVGHHMVAYGGVKAIEGTLSLGGKTASAFVIKSGATSAGAVEKDEVESCVNDQYVLILWKHENDPSDHRAYCEINFSSNGGSGTQEKEMVLWGTGCSALPECTITPPEGKVFNGWSLEMGWSGETITSLTPAQTARGYLQLYATWKTDDGGETKYALTVNNGTGSGEYVEGEVVTIAANPAAANHSFYMWDGAEGLEFVDGTSANKSTVKFKMPNHAVTLIAKYLDTSVLQVIIDPNGGEFTDSVVVTLRPSKELTLSTSKIYYTIDGSHPATSETRKEYTGPFTLTDSCKVIASIYRVDIGASEPSEPPVDTKYADFVIKKGTGGETGGDTPTPTPTPEAPRYYYSSGSGSTGAGGLSAVQNDPNGKSATDYSGGIYGLLFRTNAALSAFRGVQVDGVTIDAANYSVEGNEVYLKAVYLQTLANGKHTLTVLSGEGDATAQFTVGGVVSAPKTADAGALAYLGLALSSYVGTALVTRRKKEF